MYANMMPKMAFPAQSGACQALGGGDGNPPAETRRAESMSVEIVVRRLSMRLSLVRVKSQPVEMDTAFQIAPAKSRGNTGSMIEKTRSLADSNASPRLTSVAQRRRVADPSARL